MLDRVSLASKLVQHDLDLGPTILIQSQGFDDLVAAYVVPIERKVTGQAALRVQPRDDADTVVTLEPGTRFELLDSADLDAAKDAATPHRPNEVLRTVARYAALLVWNSSSGHRSPLFLLAVW